jgi:hypothetical protein
VTFGLSLSAAAWLACNVTRNRAAAAIHIAHYHLRTRS